MSPGDWLIALGILLLTLAAYPFTLYPLSLMVLARLRPRPIRVGQPPVTAA